MVPISETGQKYSISFHRDHVQILCVSCILRRKEWVGKIIWRFMRISPHSNPFSTFYQLYISQTFWLARHIYQIFKAPHWLRMCCKKCVFCWWKEVGTVILDEDQNYILVSASANERLAWWLLGQSEARMQQRSLVWMQQQLSPCLLVSITLASLSAHEKFLHSKMGREEIREEWMIVFAKAPTS